MKRLLFALLWMAMSDGAALGQRATQLPARPAQLPAGPVTPEYGAPPAGYPAPYPYPYSYSSTPAEGALNGMASVISSKGSYNLSTSQAAINMTEAQQNEMQNHAQYENTYFQMRQANTAYREKEAGPRPTEEQLVRLAREGAPKPVSPSEVDATTGAIKWPAALQEDDFAAQRTTLEQLSATMVAHGSLGVSDQMAARKTIESMFAELKTQIRELPPADYVASRDFLRSMIYALGRSQLE